MNEVINGWKISKVRGVSGFDYWISKHGNTHGRAIKIDGQWCAMDKLGRHDMHHCDGLEVTSKTLNGLVMSLADAEASVNSDRENRLRQDSIKS